MKTNEFRAYLKNNWSFKEYDDYFDIYFIGEVYKTSKEIKDLSISHAKSELFSKIYEYYLTPLEEREEEKKYYLKLNTNLKIIEGHNGKMMYLNYIKSDKSFYIASNYAANNIQVLFTDKEIIEFNIDTNFFIKEEVK